MAKDELLEAIERFRRKSTLKLFIENPLRTIREKRYILYLISVGFAASCATVALWLDVDTTQVVVISVILAILPPAFYQLHETTRTRKMEAEFPALIRDLGLAMKSGMNPRSAISTCAQGEYGVLTPEIKHIYNLMSWGVSFEESLLYFVKQYPTTLIRRTVSTIIEASQMGGEMGDVLENVAADIGETKALEERRSAESKPYLVVGYLGYFVFLGVLLVLSNQFLPMISEAAQAVADKPTGASVGIGGGAMQFAVTEEDVEQYKQLFFHALLIQGFCAGVITGKIGEGSAVAGLKHSVFFMVVAFITYALFF